MDIEYFEKTMQKMYEVKAIRVGLDEVASGKTLDGDDAIKGIRGKYGI